MKLPTNQLLTQLLTSLAPSCEAVTKSFEALKSRLALDGLSISEGMSGHFAATREPTPMSDEKPYNIQSAKAYVVGNFSITTPADADQFMNDLDAAFVKAFPELMEGVDAEDTDSEK